MGPRGDRILPGAANQRAPGYHASRCERLRKLPPLNVDRNPRESERNSPPGHWGDDPAL